MQQVVAQTSSTVLDAYHVALNQTVLLKNTDSQVPLQQLESLRIACIQPASASFPVFTETLEKYAEIAVLTMPESEGEIWAKALTDRYNFFVLAVPEGTLSQTALSVWNTLEAVARTAVVLFDPEQILALHPELERADILIAAPGVDYGQSLAAQVLFGGSSVQSRLDRILSPTFGLGAGITIAQATRLGYAPPELVQMDAAFLDDSISAIIQQGLDSLAYPGAQVLVAREGKVVYHKSFGNHTYETQHPVQPGDLYDLASVTKISAGVPVLMEWYGQNRLDLDASLVNYLPEVRGSNKADLSMRRILTHTAQLMAWIPFWRGTLKGQSRNPWQKHWNSNKDNDFHFKPRTFRPDSSKAYPVYVAEKLWMHHKYDDVMYRSMYKSPLNAKPGFVYSDFFFIMMPRVVRAQTGMEFEQYLKEHFYRPLGASTITFNPLRYYSPDRIIPTERDTFFRMKLLHGTVHDEGASMLGGVSGHAGLFASVNDLAKLMQMYLNFGTYGGQRFLEERAVREFIRCQYCDPEGIHRGLGFDKPRLTYNPSVATYAPQASASSFGHTGYTGTYTWMDPETNLLVIVCTNRVYPTRLSTQLGDLAIRRRVHEAAYLSIKSH